MPIFEFECPRGHVTESLESGATSVIACPACADNTAAMKRITAHGGYHIKGNNSASTRPKGAGSKSK